MANANLIEVLLNYGCHTTDPRTIDLQTTDPHALSKREQGIILYSLLDNAWRSVISQKFSPLDSGAKETGILREL